MLFTHKHTHTHRESWQICTQISVTAVSTLKVHSSSGKGAKHHILMCCLAIFMFKDLLLNFPELVYDKHNIMALDINK